MVRFTLLHKWCMSNGASGESYVTIDADVPALEYELASGGFSEDAYDYARVVGASVLHVAAQEASS